MKFHLTYSPRIFLTLAIIIVSVFWILVKNTYDLGDSITHFAISKYSWNQSYLFFDNWGKPVFTILSSPFSQLGWKGMTAFNSIIGILTAYIIAQIIYLKKWAISPYITLLLFFIPDYPLSLNSGLTEPLYGLIMIASLYFYFKNQWIIPMIILSFLPFVRSEGFITMTVFGLYYLFNNKLKYLPFLLIGTLVISLIGFLVTYDNIDWIWNNNPYNENNGHSYGNGNWLDYFTKFYYMCGIPFTFTFWLSVICLIYTFLNTLKNNIKNALQSEELLFLLLFFSYFLAHVIFWKFGIFNSFGMSRVLIALIPISLLMSIYFLNKMYNHSLILKNIVFIIIFTSLVFPFTKNKSAWKNDSFNEDPSIVAIMSIKPYIEQIKSNNTHIYYNSKPIMTLLGYNVYDTSYFHLFTNKNYKNALSDSSSIVVLDSWTTQVDYDAKKALYHLSKNKQILIAKRISDYDEIKIYYKVLK